MPWRRRTTSSANGKSRGKRTYAPNMSAENSAAPRAPPVRGSGLSRTRAVSDSGIGPAPDGGGGLRRPRSAPASVRGEGQERDVARPLDGQGELALVLGAGAEHPARQDLAPLGHEPGEELHVLVVDVVDLVRAELADLPAPEEVALACVLAAAAPGSAGTAASTARAATTTAASATAESASTEAHQTTPSPSTERSRRSPRSRSRSRSRSSRSRSRSGRSTMPLARFFSSS